MENELPDKNIFMMCEKPNVEAFRELPLGFHVRPCRREELDIWKAMPFDDEKIAKQYYNFMTDYFNNVYRKKEELFYKKCLFVCDEFDKPVATCFIWKSYDKVNTIHWLKVLKEYENRGIGRAILSIVMKDLKDSDYPIFLHTQPDSYRAIKLYSDFGFYLLSNKIIGDRHNDLEECLPILKKYMPKKDYNSLKITTAPSYFNEIVSSSTIDEF